MTMGIVHDEESLHIMRARQELRNVCSEMADGAVTVLRNGGTPEEAEKAAAEILRKNTGTEAVWELENMGNTITVKVTGTGYPAITCKAKRNIIS